MTNTYISILKNLERQSEPLWRIIRENKILQSRWIKHLRWGLNMSGEQLGRRMKISGQSARDMEEREYAETITLATLRKAANAFDMDLFYMFIPKNDQKVERALQSIIEHRAWEVAQEIVSRSSATMQLEGQGTSEESTEEAVRELADKFKIEVPSSLWD
jgi:predicted DNA-binding mobile mystery protein A